MAGPSIGAVDMLVGQRVKSARLAKGMSQDKLGEALGVTFQQVQKYEKGKNRIGAGRLRAIADLLGVPVSYFFEGAGPVKQANGMEMAAIQRALSTREGIRIAVCLARIDNVKLRQRVADLLEEIIANETKEAKVAE